MPGSHEDSADDSIRTATGWEKEQGFFDRSRGLRLMIGFTLALFVYLFVHFREVHVETLEVGTTAPKYVVAQTDFQFLDEEATIILRQEAVRDLGKIFQISEEDIRQRRAEFENYLIYNQEWRRQAEQSTFEEMYQGIDLLEEELHDVRLTDPRTLRIIEQSNHDTDNYLVFTVSDPSQPVELSQEVWNSIRSRAFDSSDLQPSTIEFIYQYFQGKTWSVAEDIVAHRAVRRTVQSRIPEKETKIHAGNRVIDQGEKVTSRHVAMLQAMKQALSDSRNLLHPVTLIGSLVLTLLLLVIATLYMRQNHADILTSNRKLFLLVTVILLTLSLAKIFEYFVVKSTTNFADNIRYPLLTPFAAILLASLMGRSVATFFSGYLAVVFALTLAIDRHGFLLTNVLAALIAVICTGTMRRRKDIFLIAGQAWLACAVAIIAIHLYQHAQLEITVLADLVSSCLFMLFTAVLVVGLLPLLESSFDIMTDSQLMEYQDPSNELLRRLTLEAPGTYQHSVVVGNLSENAAMAVGANGLFCRTASLYHDIGKLATPQYFTENQQGGMNIHQLLTPLESAQVIINHVSEGVALARKASLPEQFIDIIKEHHGTTLVYYFYRKQLEQTESEEQNVDESQFRYAGPTPRTKESGIIMIADSFEAASRALEQVNETTLTELVDSLVRQKAEDGQFDRCPLTFEEINIAKRAMVKTLMAAAHARVKYPSQEKKVVEDLDEVEDFAG